MYSNVIAFPTPEKYLGQDLDGDGRLDHTVLRYVILPNTEPINTGIDVSPLSREIDVNDKYIVFRDEKGSIKYYSLVTNEIYDTHRSGYHPVVAGNYLLFETFNAGVEIYNIKTHSDITITNAYAPSVSDKWVAFISRNSNTLQLYNIKEGKLINTKIKAFDPYIYGDIVVFDAQESRYGSDLNGDGDVRDSIIQYYNIVTGELINTKL